MDIKLSAEQETLMQIMEETNQHLFITGRAGAGKSVLLRHFRENTKKRVVCAAPTGIAALNVKGQTIHSLFRIAPQLHRKGKLIPNSRVCSLLKRIDTLVIDEISMVRADLLDAIDERLREAHKNDLPFGGVQIIMFGDVYQLPPVVEDGLMAYFEAVHNGYFFFNALVWKETDFKIFELTQVFRQKDPIFKDILNAIRDGSFNDGQIKQLNARHGASIPAEGTVTLAPTNNLVTMINQKKLEELPGEAKEYKATITGEMKKSVFPTEEILQFKKGAQIVLLKNDKDKRWVNGTVGKIEELFDEHIDVRVNGSVSTLERETWEEITYVYDPDTKKVESKVASSFTQYPIRLAWALTIHKSQGQTYESVALDLTTGTFAPGQLYVALSRATSIEGLYLKMPVKRAHIIVDAKVSAFMARRETITVAQEPQAIEAVAPIDDSVMTELPAPVVAAEPEEAAAMKTPGKRGRKATGRVNERVQYSQSPEAAAMIRRAVDILRARGEETDKSALLDEIILASPLLADILASEDPGPEDPDGNDDGGQPLPAAEEEPNFTPRATWKGLDARIDAAHAQEDRHTVSILEKWQGELAKEEPSESAEKPAISMPEKITWNRQENGYITPVAGIVIGKTAKRVRIAIYNLKIEEIEEKSVLENTLSSRVGDMAHDALLLDYLIVKQTIIN